MIAQHEELYRLIPQRPPIVMIDGLLTATPTEADTTLTILSDNIFVQSGILREPGLIEHVAQSAAAWVGYKGQNEEPKLGYIGEIKRLTIHRLPAVGQKMQTHIELLGEALDISLIAAKVIVDNVLVMECQMKIFLKSE